MRNKLNPKPLSEQTIVITGASSGIGMATALLAASKGANVVLSSRNKKDLDRIVDAIRKIGGTAIAVQADVSSRKDLEKLRDAAIAAFGTFDTWVNNAGVSIFGFLNDVPEEDERKLFDINFWGVRNGCQIAIPVLASNPTGGVLINLGSEVSHRAIPLQGMYSASKHAVKGYTDALRIELKKDHIPVAVSLIRPASIDTPYTEHAKNFLRKGEPSLPSPLHDPYEVAEEICKCAEDPQRDIFIGPGKLFAMFDALMPSMADEFLKWFGFSSQSRGGRTRHRSSHEGLDHAPAHEGKVYGHAKNAAKKRVSYEPSTFKNGVIGTAIGIAGALIIHHLVSTPSQGTFNQE